MKKILLLLFAVLILPNCSGVRQDEEAIKEVLELFYEGINERDFKTLTSITSPQMHKTLSIMEGLSDDLVIYGSYHVQSVNISGKRAFASVLSTDKFGNRTECVWNLTKSNDEWLIDVFNLSSADPVKKSSKRHNNESESIQPTEIPQNDSLPTTDTTTK